MAAKQGVIYKITCTVTNQSYIGQASLYKTKNGKPYNYGSRGRWNDHKCTAKKSDAPLYQAMRQHGVENFTLTDLESVTEEEKDVREAYWIQHEMTLCPFGFNVNEHSRSKHNRESTLYDLYTGQVETAEIRPVKKAGENSFVYLYMRMKDDSSKRLTFGQSSDGSYSDAVLEAQEFATKLDCIIKDLTQTEHHHQTMTLMPMQGNVVDVTITSASKLVAVYFMTDTMKFRNERYRVCFGGKTKTKDQAYIEAHEYINSLKLPSQVTINDKMKT